jgi:hypothetical protein
MPPELASGLELDGNPLHVLLLILAILSGTALLLGTLMNRPPALSTPRSAARAQASPPPAKPGDEQAVIMRKPPSRPLVNLRPASTAPSTAPHGVTAVGSKEARASLRRKGRPVRLRVAIGNPQEQSFLAWVTNRSRGGLGVVVTQEITAGTTLYVQAIDAPADSPWVEVLVRGCRPKGNRWLLGCMFRQELPVSVLLLFG